MIVLFRCFGGPRRLDPPYEESGPPVEVGQVGQLHTCEKAYEIRKLVNFANFSSMIRWASKTRPTLRRIRAARSKLVKLVNFTLAKKRMKYGTWSTRPTFFR